MTSIVASGELLRQLANTVSARRVSGLAAEPAMGYLLGTPDAALLAEDPVEGYSFVDVPCAPGALVASGALMLPPSVRGGVHLHCGPIGSLASLRLAAPDGVPFLGVLVIAPDAAAADLAAPPPAATFAAFARAAVLDSAGALPFWRENLRVLRGSGATEATAAAAPLVVLVAIPAPAALLGPASTAGAADIADKDGVVRVGVAGQRAFDPAYLRAFVLHGDCDCTADDDADADDEGEGQGLVVGDDDDGVVRALARPLRVKLGTSDVDTYSNNDNDNANKSINSDPLTSRLDVSRFVAFTRTLTLRIPPSLSSEHMAAYLKSQLDTAPALTCVSSNTDDNDDDDDEDGEDNATNESSRHRTTAAACVLTSPTGVFEPLLLPSPSPPTVDTIAAAAAAAAAASGGNEASPLLTVPVTVVSQSAPVSAPLPLVLSVDTNDADKNAAAKSSAAAAAASAAAAALPAPVARPCTVTLAAVCVFSRAVHGALTADRVAVRLACALREQAQLLLSMLAAPALLAHETGLFSRGVGADAFPAAALTTPALAAAAAPPLSAAAAAAAADAAAALSGASGGASAGTGEVSAEVRRLMQRLQRWVSPFPLALPAEARAAFSAAEAAYPSYLLPVAYTFTQLPAPGSVSSATSGNSSGSTSTAVNRSASLWAFAPLVALPHFDLALPADASASSAAAGGSNTDPVFSPLAAATARALRAAATDAVALALARGRPVADSLTPLPLPAAAAAIKTHAMPSPGADVGALLPPRALAAARTEQLRAALAWRLGTETACGTSAVPIAAPVATTM